MNTDKNDPLLFGSSLISWAAWIRTGRRGRWRLFCRRATEAECRQALTKAAQGADKLILQGNRDPNSDDKVTR